jgi:putative ABC transport system permease protein
VLTSAQVSRLNIIRAIRDLDEPPRRQGRVLWVALGGVLAALGVLTTLQGAATTDGFGLLLGPTLVVVGLAPLAARFYPAHAVNTGAALLVVVWGATLFALFPSSTEGASVMLYVVQGIVLTAAAVALLSLQQERISRILRAVSGGRSIPLRLGLAYPLARRSRTGLTIAMYALVVFILTFITSLAHMIDQQVAVATKTCRAGTRSSSRRAPRARDDEAGRRAGRRHDRGAALTRDGVLPGRRHRGALEPDCVRTAVRRRWAAEARGSRRLPSDRAAWARPCCTTAPRDRRPSFLQNGGGPAPTWRCRAPAITVKDPYTGRTPES